MAKTFGLGEYERSDVEIRTSTLHQRYQFLQTLVNRKGIWIKTLLNLANYDLIPSEVWDEFTEEHIYCFFLAYIYGDNPWGINLQLEIVDTPFNRFLSFLEKKRSILADLENNPEIILYASNPLEGKRMALRKLLPNWGAVKSDPDGKLFCESLVIWATHFNLTDEWCLDFIIDALINFTTLFHFEPEEFRKTEQELFKNRYIYPFKFDQSLREALRDSLMNLHSAYVAHLWLPENTLKTPPFIFRHCGEELFEKTWDPIRRRRSQFIEEATTELHRGILAIQELAKWPNLDEESFRINLNNYCDEIKARAPEAGDNSKPYEIKHSGLVLLSSIWAPSKTTQQEFIDESIESLKSAFNNYHEIAKNIRSLSIPDFNLKIGLYCNKIRKGMPSNYIKTPTKYKDNRDFEWLVDYQVRPFKEYVDIMSDIGVMDSPSISGIKKAVERIAKQIGLSLRRPKVIRTGRPKGVKETKPRRREKRSIGDMINE